jgi:hypothetical protein
VYPVLILIGKLESHVDDEDLVFVLEDHRVQPDLFTSSEWYDSECAFFEGFDSLFWECEVLLQCLCRCEEGK